MFDGKRPNNDTGVCCPSCRAGTIVIHFSCLQTYFTCTHCGGRFSLDRLVNLVDSREFEILEQVVAHRLSDRI
jgi:hypothetical protein